MNEDELISKIEEEISVTERKIKDLRNLTKPISPRDAIGRVSRMDAINNKSVNQNSLRQAEVKLSNLKRVLENVGTPNFGICVKCKNQIPIGRILIRPQSLLCVNCAR